MVWSNPQLCELKSPTTADYDRGGENNHSGTYRIGIPRPSVRENNTISADVVKMSNGCHTDRIGVYLLLEALARASETSPLFFM
jgi:hypothetical protein